ncbi:uncharacterized protein LOC132043920 [Lycium ferocissimum]|uniref:uncharacterized protein LOC132043920 n=1 Tax=Lycium ferocissimum TaxID=112874 RepID=UPI002815F2A8|nr:uncharacterized protein LOC132043920 [Lycium ferocissimum]
MWINNRSRKPQKPHYLAHLIWSNNRSPLQKLSKASLHCRRLISKVFVKRFVTSLLNTLLIFHFYQVFHLSSDPNRCVMLAINFPGAYTGHTGRHSLDRVLTVYGAMSRSRIASSCLYFGCRRKYKIRRCKATDSLVVLSRVMKG